METRINEIADGVYRLSTLVPEVAAPAGFTFNQFLLMADEPLLFHCGHRGMFDSIRGAIATLMPIEKLRWISFSHLEADESGAMNLWQQAAPYAQVAHGKLGCDVSLNDLSLRMPRALEDNEVLDLGGKRVRYLATPHVPHGWDAGLMYEEENGVLLCSDILGQVGDVPALAKSDIVGPALDGEDLFRSMSVTPDTIATLNRLAALKPRTLAIMHGSSLAGDGAAALRGFAEGLSQQRLAKAA
ncbi:MAG TPA: MBL fold metallo-hydrolase [Woeseiaceae bacterium]|nr:MBL fold metallo-hydrolase [Woeseiaceae bacterium]